MIDLHMCYNEPDADDHFEKDQDHHELHKPEFRLAAHGTSAGVVGKDIDDSESTDAPQRELR